MSGGEDEHARLRRLRKAAARAGWTLLKARRPPEGEPDAGGFMLVDSATSVALLGFEPPYSATIEEVEAHLGARRAGMPVAPGIIAAAFRPEATEPVRGVSVSLQSAGTSTSARRIALVAEERDITVLQDDRALGRGADLGEVTRLLVRTLRAAETIWFGSGKIES